MASSIHYKSCATDVSALVHTCDACHGTEMARIRGIALIKPGTSITIPLTSNEWQTAILAGNIIIIPRISGSLDDAEKEGDGYGDEKSRLLGHDYTLNFKDPDYAANKDFYEAAEKQGWHLAYRTETQLHIVDNAEATLVAKQTVEESLDSPLVWDVTLKWTSDTKPKMAATTPVRQFFECFDIQEDPDEE